MRLPTATLLTACALSAALLVAGRVGAEEKITMPGADAVLPAAEGRVVSGDPFADPPAAHPDSAVVSDEDADAGEGSGSDLDRGVDPAEIGPETVPEIPDLPDGGGLIPDGPDESDALDPSDSVFGSPVDVVMG
ncbi:hypothetical protein [Streptomyces sp. NPDC005476]|uniref:hypothetical protein n=1 Tax=Streptomyces sp. NPDC005476 TaxID=3156882 RepID=UPI0034550A4F